MISSLENITIITETSVGQILRHISNTRHTQEEALDEKITRFIQNKR